MTEKDREIRILERDAAEVKLASEEIREMKLINAVRGGIRQGGEQKMRRKYSYAMGAIAAAAAVMLGVFSFVEKPWGTNNIMETGSSDKELVWTTVAKTTRSWSDSEYFKSTSVQEQQSFVSALDRNLIAPVYQSAEKNGLRLEVMGALTDGRKVYVLNRLFNNTDQTVRQGEVSLDYYGGISAPSRGASLDIQSPGASYVWPGETGYFVYSANLTPTVTYSKDVMYNVAVTGTSEEALLSSSHKYRTELSVQFELDPEMFKEKKRTLYPEKTLTVDGQKILIHQVLYTPLNTYVDIEYDAENDMHIYQLINPVLFSKSGSEKEKLYYRKTISSYNSEMYKDQSKAILVFDNSQNVNFDSASIKTAGIAAIEKDRTKVVVDLVQKKLIEAPTSDLTVVQPEMPAEAEEIQLLQVIDKGYTFNSFKTQLSNTFTDAEGKRYERPNYPGTSYFGGRIGYSKEDRYVDEISYYFGKGALDYPQPLTIEVEQYWNPILETQELEL